MSAGHGQQVGEAGRPEGLERLVVERRSAAQRDPRRDARRLVVTSGSERRACPAPQPVEYPWRPPRLPTCVSVRAASVSCTPCRASHLRRSKVAGGGWHGRRASR